MKVSHETDRVSNVRKIMSCAILQSKRLKTETYSYLTNVSYKLLLKKEEISHHKGKVKQKTFSFYNKFWEWFISL